MSTARALSCALFAIAFSPACATEPLPDGSELVLPCAAIGFYEGSSDFVEHFRYEYDELGNETRRFLTVPGEILREARIAEYEGDQLVHEEIQTEVTRTVRTITLDRGRPVDDVATTYDDGFETETHLTSQWRFEDSPPSLVEQHLQHPLWGVITRRYRALTDQAGFTVSECWVEAGECMDIDSLGPYAYVGDERGWTSQRLLARSMREPGVFAERSFDDHGRVSVLTEYRLAVGVGGQVTRTQTYQTTWTRDRDGRLLGWYRTHPLENAYRYEAQYDECSTR